MSLTIVIPCYSINKELLEMATVCALSYRNQAEEIIVVEDGGIYSEELRKIADIYVYSKKNVGFTKSVNRGWKLSSGDFTGIVNSDTHHLEGDIKKLCIPHKVTSPEIVSQSISKLAGCFFVVPKDITEQRGYLREEMRTYSSDSEYEKRIEDIFQRVPEVRIFHHIAQTVKTAGIEGGIEQRQDRITYFNLIKQGKAK